MFPTKMLGSLQNNEPMHASIGTQTMSRKCGLDIGCDVGHKAVASPRVTAARLAVSNLSLRSSQTCSAGSKHTQHWKHKSVPVLQ